MNFKVLIIDDEEEICLLLSGILRSMGYETDCAGTLGDGFDKLLKHQPQVVFLDLNLPDGSGFTLIPKIKESSPETRVIIISAYDGGKERTTARKFGADHFIGKPFNKNLIKEAMLAVAQIEPQ
jgi:DNA-binding response OmpR family regulator